MLIKSAEDRVADIETLTQLLSLPGLASTVRARIEQEIRAVRAGAKGESEAAYEIDFYHRASTRCVSHAGNGSSFALPFVRLPVPNSW